MYHIIPLLFYGLVILCFISDLCIVNLVQASYIHILLCFYTLLIFRTTSRAQITVTACTLLAKDFIVHGLFGLPLVYLVPLTVGAHCLKKRLFYQTSLFHYLFVTLALLAQIYLIEWALLGLYQPINYVFFSIFGTLIVLFCLLNYKLKGEQDNRL